MRCSVSHILPIKEMAFFRAHVTHCGNRGGSMGTWWGMWWREHLYLAVAMFAVAFDPDRNLEIEYAKLMRGELQHTLGKITRR